MEEKKIAKNNKKFNILVVNNDLQEPLHNHVL